MSAPIPLRLIGRDLAPKEGEQPPGSIRAVTSADPPRRRRIDGFVAVIRRGLRALGIEAVRAASLARLQRELGDLRAYRVAAERELHRIQEHADALEDEVRVERDYASALSSLAGIGRRAGNGMAGQAPTSPSSITFVDSASNLESDDDIYPSCRWIEAGASFVPGRLRVCPNTNAHGGPPGVIRFLEGRLPVEEILARRAVIREANRAGGFAPCGQCAYRERCAWKPRPYVFDILCIAHATACNLACHYCHTIPESRYLQNPGAVPSLLPTISSLISEGLLAPDARIQWGGGEPTILREFEALFGLLHKHGAFSEVYTSGLRVPPILLESVAEGRAGVMVSLDSGTRETYKRIKGRDAFDRVLSNVGRCARANPGRTLLKMILSRNNHGEVRQFLDVAEAAGVRIVCYDTMMYEDHVDDDIIESAARFRLGAEARGLECRPGEVGLVYNVEDRVSARVDAAYARLTAEVTTP